MKAVADMSCRDVHEIELALRSPTYLRVLRVLLQNRDKHLSKYYIAKESGLYNPSRIVENLVKLGWIKTQEISGVKRYKINMKNVNVRALYEFFIRVRYI